jgi:hypothetical protein
MSNVSSVAATIQLIIKIVWYTKSSNKKLTHPSDPNNIFLWLLSHLPLHPPLKLPTPPTNLRYP